MCVVSNISPVLIIRFQQRFLLCTLNLYIFLTIPGANFSNWIHSAKILCKTYTLLCIFRQMVRLQEEFNLKKLLLQKCISLHYAMFCSDLATKRTGMKPYPYFGTCLSSRMDLLTIHYATHHMDQSLSEKLHTHVGNTHAEGCYRQKIQLQCLIRVKRW